MWLESAASNCRDNSLRASLKDSTLRAFSGFSTFRLPGLFTTALQFLDAFLNSGFCVNQSLAGISHDNTPSCEHGKRSLFNVQCSDRHRRHFYSLMLIKQSKVVV